MIKLDIDENLLIQKVVKKISVKGIVDRKLVKSINAKRDDLQIKVKVTKILKRIRIILGLNWESETDELILKIVEDQYISTAYYDVYKNEITIKYAKLNEYVLAHELTHYVLNRDIGDKIPERMHEILAVYVYKNLKKSKLLWIGKLEVRR